MVFTQKFESSSQYLSISVFKNLIFQPSEAQLSSITQNWNKSLSFHNCVPKGLTNFECPIWKLHTLNYHIYRPFQCRECLGRFKNESDLTAHLSKDHFRCKYCDKALKTQTSMKEHIRLHWMNIQFSYIH